MNGAEAVSDDEVESPDDSLDAGQLVDEVGSYRKVAWLGFFMLGGLVLAVVLDEIVGAPVIGGLLATTVLLTVSFVVSIAVVGIIYRAVSSVLTESE